MSTSNYRAVSSCFTTMFITILLPSSPKLCFYLEKARCTRCTLCVSKGSAAHCPPPLRLGHLVSEVPGPLLHCPSLSCQTFQTSPGMTSTRLCHTHHVGATPPACLGPTQPGPRRLWLPSRPPRGPREHHLEVRAVNTPCNKL